MIHVTALHTYPIKSCAGLTHTSIELDARGPLWDRRWMVVEPDGMFVTQRELPRMALIQPAFEGDQLRLTAPGMSELCIPLAHDAAPTRTVTVWESVCQAWDEGGTAAEWFSDFLQVELRLVRMADDFQRVIDNDYAKQSTRALVYTGFADGFPILIVSGSIAGGIEPPPCRARRRPCSHEPLPSECGGRGGGSLC
ncbi:MAG: MOSC domain-containing protein [Anaerolineae bacterium]